jgi:hypothetical protein
VVDYEAVPAWADRLADLPIVKDSKKGTIIVKNSDFYSLNSPDYVSHKRPFRSELMLCKL